MQAESPPSPPASTHQRLLDAAARVFARDGLTGATTRAIADEAGVNEVTLFRHFQSKDRLIAAVIGENFGPKSASAHVALPAVTADFRTDLIGLAACYETHLTENLSLVRTLIGESHHLHHCSHEKLIFRGIFLPLKEAALARIAAAQQAHQIRADLRAEVLSDLFFAMIFTGVLRRSSSHTKIDYPAAAYRETAVTLFLEGARTGATARS